MVIKLMDIWIDMKVLVNKTIQSQECAERICLCRMMIKLPLSLSLVN